MRKTEVCSLAEVFTGRTLENCEVYLDKCGRIYQGEGSSIQEITLHESIGVFKRAYIYADGIDFAEGFEDWLDMIQTAIPEKRVIWKFKPTKTAAKLINRAAKAGVDRDRILNQCIRMHFASGKKVAE